MKIRFYNLAVIIVTLVFGSCGGDSNSDWQPATSGQDTGLIKAVITNSKSFNPNISHGQILQYTITITAEDMAPIIAAFDGAADSGVVDGIPTGGNRTLKVEAINSNGASIREGIALGLEVVPGGMTEAEVAMESVPVFANLAEGNTLPNTQFAAKVFSDPADPVAVEDEFDGVTLPLFDVSAGGDEVFPDISGIAKIVPPLVPAGEHKFTVKNVRTGRHATVTVFLTDGARLKAAPFYSASSNQPTWFGVADFNPR